MGILNVTPDSFSDGGRWDTVTAAVSHALEMADSGADVIDVGGESTRPGSSPVSAGVEARRLLPVLRELVPVLDIPVSVDTMKAEVAEACLSLGAEMVNDVSGLADPGMAGVCASADANLVVMHVPAGVWDAHRTTMGPGFAEEIRSMLARGASKAMDAGVCRDRIVLDPGIGFGKTVEQNSWILDHSSYFSDGFPVLSGSSRKRFVAATYPGEDIDDASASAALRASDSGADIVRVHDVARTAAALGRLSRAGTLPR